MNEPAYARISHWKSYARQVLERDPKQSDEQVIAEVMRFDPLPLEKRGSTTAAEYREVLRDILTPVLAEARNGKAHGKTARPDD